ncbi:MAG: DUF2520 domain-containing protein [Saprospirales bacterium]|nr:DUF2520 domain-containing protein [Saprospirales bacterium]
MNRVTLIGAGNVAHHMGKALYAAGVTIEQIFSRNQQKSNDLALLVSAEAISDLSRVKPCDLVILAVSDSAIPEIAATLSRFLPADTFVVHTSGATPSAFVASHFRRYGVFYPPQTFTIGVEISFAEAPLCIHAGNEEDLRELEELGKRISTLVFRINDQQRQWLHLTAVVVNNFPNHLYALAEEVLQDHQIPFDLLRPLILETARKVQTHSPAPMQTGPARRGDQATIEAHLYLLEAYPELKEVYEVLTKNIFQKIQ